ncbi:MAG TPA: YncE family protein [Terriglobales bacterium]
MAGLLVAVAIELSCGDVFRPIAIPSNPHPPDPESLHFALVVADNGPDVCPPQPPLPPGAPCDDSAHPSTSSRIDVSGDTNVGTATVGLGPVHAGLTPSGSQAFVVNKLEDTVSSYPTSTATTVNTISLPLGSQPVFAHTTESGNVYIANSGNDTVSVISTSRNVVTRTIAVGSRPVALAETPDAKKLYAVNQGDGTVTVINTVDGSITAPPLAVGASPAWAAARSDSAFVYVLSPGNQIAVINTLTDLVSDTVPVPNANFAFYDKTLNRIYLTTSDRKLLILNVASATPVALGSVDLSIDPTGGSNPPCPAACVLDSVTALPDGSRAYVASHEIVGTCTVPDLQSCTTTTRVTIVKTPQNNVLSTITTQSGIPKMAFCDQLTVRRYIAAAADSSRVYVTNCDAGGTDIIRTSNDSFVLDLPGPVSSLPTIPTQSFPPPQRPIFVVPGR